MFLANYLSKFSITYINKNCQITSYTSFPTNMLLYFDLECNSLFKRNLLSLVCLFLHSIHGLCNGDQKIQRFLTFLTDSDVRHIFYLYKGKKMIYRSFVPFPKYFLQSFSFQKSLFWIFNWSNENAILECVAKTAQNANVKMKSYIVSHFWIIKAFLLYSMNTTMCKI